jgi:hypothetical protein
LAKVCSVNAHRFWFSLNCFLRRYKGPSNNPFARHPGNALLTRLATPPRPRRMCSSHCCLLEQWQQTSRQLHRDLYPILRKLEREGLKYFARKGESFRFLNANDSAQSSPMRQHKLHD